MRLALERAFRNVIPVEAFSQDRTETVQVDTPEIGLRWGKPSSFDWSQEKLKEGSETGSTVTIIWAKKYRESVKNYNLSPVYRQYNVVRVYNANGQYIDVQDTRLLLIPLSVETQEIITGVSGTGKPIFEPRIIETFLELTLPSAVSGERQSSGSEGEYPDLPRELSYAPL